MSLYCKIKFDPTLSFGSTGGVAKLRYSDQGKVLLFLGCLIGKDKILPQGVYISGFDHLTGKINSNTGMVIGDFGDSVFGLNVIVSATGFACCN